MLVPLEIPPNYMRLHLKDEPELLHLIRSGFKDNEGRSEWFVFWENAYETEPYRSGVRIHNENEIRNEFKVDIQKLLDNGKI